jgi:transcriptional regulator with XRE-family HTH domain
MTEDGGMATKKTKRKDPPAEAESHEAATLPVADEDLQLEAGAPDVGPNLRRIRMERGMALEALARGSGVSRAMLSQIELGRSTPTIKVLWKIARALGLPFSALLSSDTVADEVTVLRADKAKRLTSHDSRFSSRALFPTDRPRRVEFYELRLAPRGVEEAEPHPPGTMENLLVSRGTVEVKASGATHELSPGDAIQFRADMPHVYRNTGAVEAVMYLVMSYADIVASSSGWSV